MVLVSLSAALPMLGVLVGLTWVRLEERQARQLERLQGQATSLAAAVEVQLQRDLTVLRTMALSPEAQHADWAGMQAYAQRALAADPMLEAIALVLPDGGMAFQHHVAGAGAWPPDLVAAATQAVRAPGSSGVLPLRPGAAPSGPLFDLGVPLRTGLAEGAVPVLVASVRARALAAMLQAMPLPANGLATVLDENGLIVARSRDAARWVGQPATPTMQALLRRGPGGTGVSDTVDGLRVYAAVAAVGDTGWHVAVGLPVETFQLQRSRELGLVMLLGVPLALAGVVLSLALGRRLASQVRAAAVGESTGRTGVREVARLSDRVDAARRDPLTGLASRAGWQEQVSHRHARGGVGAVLFMDLDGFKSINDQRGHDAGDLALQAVAGVLRDHLRPGDLAGRLGGDEFVVALEATEADPLEIAKTVAQRVVDGVAALGNGLGCSIGVAVLRAGEALPAGLDRADRAMLRAKRAGKNRIATDEV